MTKTRKNKPVDAGKTYRERYDESYESLAGLISRLKTEREDREITIDSMAERLDENESTISQIEDGSDVPISVLINYALALGHDLKFSMK